ncbi:MAG: hypothetical protein KC468_14305, partial [Myxococcales bacterium]|nr:hypothetical protein [Myxococcales bacterium]
MIHVRILSRSGRRSFSEDPLTSSAQKQPMQFLHCSIAKNAEMPDASYHVAITEFSTEVDCLAMADWTSFLSWSTSPIPVPTSP